MSAKTELWVEGIQLRNWDLGEHKTTCPRCSHKRKKKTDPCLSVRLDPNEEAVWNCWHCGWKGGIYNNGHDHNSSPQPQKHRPPPRPAAKPDTIPADQTLLDWMEKRGISQEIVERQRIYSLGQGEAWRIVFPYLKGGLQVNRKYRTHDKKFTQDPGAERTFYNIDAIGDSETAIIVEGEMDVLACLEAGINEAITLPDGAPAKANMSGNKRYEPLNTCNEQLKNVKRYILAGDADDPGGFLIEELARRIGRDRCWLVKWPEGCKDANETLIKHGPKAVQECIHNCHPYPIVGVYTFQDYFDEIDELYEFGVEPTVSTGWKSIDQIMKIPVNRGLLWIVTGWPNSGKSEWIDALAVNLAKSHGWATGYCSFENPPDIHGVKLLEKYLEMPFFDGPTPRMGRQDLERGKKFVKDHFPLIRAEDDSPTLDWLFEKMRAVVTRFGVRMVVIDPYNEIEHQRPGNMNETEYVSKMLGRFRRFASTHGCHIFLVAHPQKLRRMDNGEMPVPSLNEISGSANFSNKADFGVVISRSVENQSTEVYVRKCRFKQLGEIGMSELSYEKSTGVYQSVRKAGLS